MKTCELCRKPFADASFIKGGGKISRACAGCRKKRQARKIKDYYRGLSPDERNRVTMARRAKQYGVKSESYSRIDVLTRWGNRCAYCDDTAAHLDHVHPLSRGGDDVESNILPACSSCNLSKGAKSLAEWAETF